MRQGVAPAARTQRNCCPVDHRCLADCWYRRLSHTRGDGLDRCVPQVGDAARRDGANPRAYDLSGASSLLASMRFTPGILVIGTAGIILAPIFHRVLHSLHVEDDEDEKKDEKKAAGKAAPKTKIILVLFRGDPHEADHRLDRFVFRQPLGLRQRLPDTEVNCMTQRGSAQPALLAPTCVENSHPARQHLRPAGHLRRHHRHLDVAVDVHQQPVIARVVAVGVRQRDAKSDRRIGDQGPPAGIGGGSSCKCVGHARGEDRALVGEVPIDREALDAARSAIALIVVPAGPPRVQLKGRLGERRCVAACLSARARS